MTRHGPIYGWDIEAVEWDRPVLAVVCSEHGDESVFRGADCLRRVADHMRRHPGTYVAHYGGGYDVPLLMNVRGFPEIVLTGTNILAARDGYRLTLRDTFPWWLASLKRVGEAVGLAKLEVDRGDIAGMSENDLVDYCVRDVHVLLRGVSFCNAFLDEHGAARRWTAGSSAVSLVQALEPGSWRALIENRNDVDDVRTFLDEGAGKGGRTECMARGVYEGVTSLDFKSSYPARYADREVGYGMRRADPAELRLAERDPGHADVAGLVAYGSWDWPHRGRIAPALDFASACGFGRGEGWLIEEEIRAFAEQGVRVLIDRGWLPREIGAIGQVFARVMFAAKESGGPAAFFAKVFLNSWHGKNLEHPIKEHFTRWRPEEGEYIEGMGIDVVGDREARPDACWFRYNSIECGEDNRCEPYQQPVMGELILGRARAALYREAFRTLERAGIPVLYCDTDSCHALASEARCREVLGDVMGSTIGKLSVEATGCTGYYLGPKAYLLVDGAGKVVKSALKGIPLKSYARGTVDADGLFREARAGEAGTDVRVRIFEQALRGEPARCLKDGVSTFLRGAHGFVGADGTRRKSFWGRAPQVREVRTSGRGKSFTVDREDPVGKGADWRYVSVLESVAWHALRKIDRGGYTLARWALLPESARVYLLGERAVVLTTAGERGGVRITEGGRRLLRQAGEFTAREDRAHTQEREGGT